MQDAIVIINPVSGARGRPDAGRERAASARALAARAGRRVEIVITEGSGHAGSVARAACAQGVSLVIVWGGDGTVNEVGNAIAFSPTRLAVIPAGSGNGLALELGLKRNPQAAFDNAFTGTDVLIDAGEIEGRLFFNVAGVGFDALVAEVFNRRAPGRRGAWPYVAATLRSLWTFRPASYTVRVEDRRLQCTALLIAFANGRQYGNRARIAPLASMQDGRLDLVIVEGRSRVGNLWRARRLFLGSVLRDPGVTHLTFTEAVVGSASGLRLHVDGESTPAGTLLRVRARPAALWIRVPASTATRFTGSVRPFSP